MPNRSSRQTNPKHSGPTMQDVGSWRRSSSQSCSCGAWTRRPSRRGRMVVDEDTAFVGTAVTMEGAVNSSTAERPTARMVLVGCVCHKLAPA